MFTFLVLANIPPGVYRENKDWISWDLLKLFHMRRAMKRFDKTLTTTAQILVYGEVASNLLIIIISPTAKRRQSRETTHRIHFFQSFNRLIKTTHITQARTSADEPPQKQPSDWCCAGGHVVKAHVDDVAWRWSESSSSLKPTSPRNLTPAASVMRPQCR